MTSRPFKVSLGHPLTWLGITLLLLLAGYAWLSVGSNNPSSAENYAVVKKIIPESISSASKDEINQLDKSDQMPITKESDEGRAKSYLQYEAVEQQILPLLDAADVHFEVGQYVNPPGDNAWEDYQAILAINPGESIATAGLTKIKSRLISGAEQSIDKSEFAEAESWLVQLDKIQPGDSIQIDLRAELSALIAAEAERNLRQQETEALQQKIQTSLAQAAEEELNKPINYNKLKDLYDRVSELDPINAEARSGLIRLSDRKLDEVEQWLRDDNISQAQIGLDQAFSIFPANKRISSLNLALDASKKQKQQQDQQKLQQAALAEEEAEAENLRRQAQAEKLRQQQLTADLPQKPAEEAARPNPPVQQTKNTTTALKETVLSDELKKIAAQKKILNQGVKAYYSGDYIRSFELLYPLAQDQVPRAQFRIGIMYQFGRSVPVNKDLAEKWFTSALPELLRAAQQGVAWAQTDLGTAYEFGISLQQDYERAAFWYQRAANGGYAGAQTNLGVLYAQGDGVSYDRAKAVFWLRKAAAQGDRVALENLGIMGVTP